MELGVKMRLSDVSVFQMLVRVRPNCLSSERHGYLGLLIIIASE